MNLGAVIRAQRLKREWSIDALVERLGDIKGGDRASLSKIENDQRWPRPELIEAIASAFDLRVSELFALAEGDRAAPVPDYLNESEAALVQRYRTMTPEARYHVDAIASALQSTKG